MMLTGGLAGLMAPYPVLGFGVVPLNFGIGSAGLHDIAEEVEERLLTEPDVAHAMAHVDVEDDL